MREFGKIKWFGGYNAKTERENNFGFLARSNKPDLYIHRAQTPKDCVVLREREAVSFEVITNPQTHKEEAQALQLLSQENDLEVLAQASQSLDPDLHLPAMQRLLTLQETEKAVEHALLVLPNLSTPAACRAIAKLFPTVALARNPQLRKWLFPDERIDIYCAWLNKKFDKPLSGSLRKEFADTAREASSQKRNELLSALPHQLFRESKRLRSLLPPEKQFDLIFSLLNGQNEDISAAKKRDVLIAELADVLGKVQEGYWQKLPLFILLEPDIGKIAPERCIKLIVGHPQHSKIPKRLLKEYLATLLEMVVEAQRLALIRPIQNWASTYEEIVVLLPLHTLPANEQLSWAWNLLLKKSASIWMKLTRDAKIWAVYRAAKEDVYLPISDKPDDEADPLVRVALLLLHMRDRRLAMEQQINDDSDETPSKHASIRPKRDFAREAKATFNQVHTLIQDYVIAQAWSSTDTLDLYPLLPLCRPALCHVAYCEGRLWEKKQGFAFCPRHSGPCSFHDSTQGSYAEHRSYYARKRDSEKHIDRGSAHESATRIYRGDWTSKIWFDPTFTIRSPHLSSQKQWKLVEFDTQSNEYIYARQTNYRRGFSEDLKVLTNNPSSQLIAEAREEVYYTFKGAHVQAIREQDWRNWSIIELLNVAVVKPTLPELRNPEEYVSKLSGWVNRLNEIRERLKCSQCSTIMQPNYTYARRLAAYSTTVVSCNQGTGHDQNIYLNHCWACMRIIDSRESQFQAGKFYICKHCGSGPRQNYIPDAFIEDFEWEIQSDDSCDLPTRKTNMLVPPEYLTADTFAQGDICPHCGTYGMAILRHNSKCRTCHQCGYGIALPSKRYWTGPTCKRCNVGKMILAWKDSSEGLYRVCLNCDHTMHVSS